MAILGKWSGNSITVGNAPETFSTAPAIFPTEDRNDGSVYSATSSGLLTLPSSGLADGYLIVAMAEFFDNGARYNPQLQIIQASGTGNFVGGPCGSYLRDASEDRALARCWAFVDGPSVSSTFQIQWKADTDDADAADTTEVSELIVIPWFYSNIGMYINSNSDLLAGTTPNQVPGWTVEHESDTNAIELVTNVITVKTDNRRYPCFGSQFYEGRGGRTQRWIGFREDSTKEDGAKACVYYRNTANDENGLLYSWLLDRVTTDITLDHFCYRGDGVSAGQGGADGDGSSPGVGDHACVVLELNSGAECFRAADGTSDVDITNTGGIQMPIFETANIDFADSASFLRVSDTAMNAEVAMDVFCGVNCSYASEVVADGSRLTERSELTIDGTTQGDTRSGNYSRGNQSTLDTFGGSCNMLDFLGLAADEDIGFQMITHAGSEAAGDNWRTQDGWVGFWGVNLNTLEDAAVAALQPQIMM